MSKIDTSLIDGFDQMTNEQKVEALSNYEFEVDITKDETYKKLKQSFDNTSSEVANLKKQLKANMSDVEKEKLAQAEKDEKYKEALRKISVMEDTEILTSLGFDKDDSGAIANALADANLEADQKQTIWNALKGLNEKNMAKIKAELINSTPKPNGSTGGGNDGMTKEKIMAIRDSAKRQEEISKHPELFIKNYQK